MNSKTILASKKTIVIIGLFLLVFTACKKDNKNGNPIQSKENGIVFDSTSVNTFFAKHPDFKPFEPQVKELYQKHNYHYVWYDKGGRIDFAEVLYNKANQIDADGIQTQLPYKAQLDNLFTDDNDKPNPNSELLISSMYFFYAKKVFEGVDTSKSEETGWYLPREKTSYIKYLDELLKDPKLIANDKSEMISQYYNLKKGLQFYRQIKQKGGWDTITLEGNKALKPENVSASVAQIRKRLIMTGEFKGDTVSTTYDTALLSAVNQYQKNNNLKVDKNITPALVKNMNVSVEDRIKTIVVNMERCRWISPDIAEAKELIAVNIPSYRLIYFRNGKSVLESNVVVGKALNKTVVFSGKMSYLVFSPYWNIPPSIIAKEIKPGMAADKNYLEKHNMEWNGGNVRQKPGKDNSLGLVKFMFPNTNNIYLHDTPAKSLFDRESRAFSHGCVRVEHARDLALAILEGDKKWNAQKIDTAMNAGKETNYTLKHKIPVYIAYFTAWADADGKVRFFEDVYSRDSRLASLLYDDKAK